MRSSASLSRAWTMHGTHGPHLPSALRPRAETAEQQQAPQELETVVQVRPGVESVQLGEICASEAQRSKCAAGVTDARAAAGGAGAAGGAHPHAASRIPCRSVDTWRRRTSE